jgi:hypothetical protein
MAAVTSLNSYRHQISITLTSNVGEYVLAHKSELPEAEAALFNAYSPTHTEKFGDWMLSPLTSIPRVYGYLKNNPSAGAVAATTALVALVLTIFYPKMMENFVEKGFHFVTDAFNLNRDYTKMVGCAVVIYPIVGWGVRAVGRFQNTAFDKIFKRQVAPTPPPKPKKEGELVNS